MRRALKSIFGGVCLGLGFALGLFISVVVFPWVMATLFGVALR